MNIMKSTKRFADSQLYDAKNHRKGEFVTIDFENYVGQDVIMQRRNTLVHLKMRKKKES
jgi:hypothetical protein